MKIIKLLILIFALAGCKNTNDQKIDIICSKSFIYEEGNLFRYYFVIDVLNRTSNKVEFRSNKIKYNIDDSSINLYLRFANQILNNPDIDSKDKRRIWKIQSEERLKLMYYAESDKIEDEEYIYFIKNNKKVDSTKIPKYVKLKKDMSFERAVYEVDGKINGSKPQITW